MSLDRDAVVSWYRRNRERSRALFDLLTDEAYYSQPIALRHPIVFYEGHLPAFSFNTLVKRGLGRPSIDARLETLFARGIDPSPDAPAQMAQTHGDTAMLEARTTPAGWPSRDEVHQFADEADRRVLDALEHADVDRPGHPLLDRAEAVFTILEHEAMHQETLLYMWHRLPFEQKRRPADYRPVLDAPIPPVEWVEVPDGRATLGVDRDAVPFGWDNEFQSSYADVPPFAIERHDVTNAQFLEFVNQGGYEDERWWRPEDWQWVQRERIRHPLFWEREPERPNEPQARNAEHWWSWRGMFERIPLAAVVAGVRQPRGSVGVRALARRAAADRSRIPARGVRLA